MGSPTQGGSMKGKSVCEGCEKEFEWQRFKNQTTARFCCKKCWYEWNARNLAKFNEDRFQWGTATKEEKMARLRQNFESKVIRLEGCWDWKGVFDKDGYGFIHSGHNKQMRAHRAAYLLFKGIDPCNLLVCHKCDNPKCTNPDHLFLGNHKDNDTDSREKGRAAIGSKQPQAKITEENVKLVKKLLNEGVKSCLLAKSFGLSTSQISAIKNGRSWKHVED